MEQQNSFDRPRFRHDLVAQPIEEEGIHYVDVTDPGSGATFRFYDVEYSIACAMDGVRDLSGLAEWTRVELGIETNVDELAGVVSTLAELGYLDPTEGEAPDAHAPNGEGHTLEAVHGEEEIHVGEARPDEAEPAPPEPYLDEEAPPDDLGQELRAAMSAEADEPATRVMSGPTVREEPAPSGDAELVFGAVALDVEPKASPVVAEAITAAEEAIPDEPIPPATSAPREVPTELSSELSIGDAETPEVDLVIEGPHPQISRLPTPLPTSPSMAAVPLPERRPQVSGTSNLSAVDEVVPPKKRTGMWVAIAGVAAIAATVAILQTTKKAPEVVETQPPPVAEAPPVVEPPPVPEPPPAPAPRPKARLVAKNPVTVEAKATHTGKVVWTVTDGDRVEAGAPVAKLVGAKKWEAELEKAKARLAFYEAELGKTKGDAGLEKKVAEKKAVIAKAEKAISAVVIEAPAGGPAQLLVGAGAIAKAGSPVVRIGGGEPTMIAVFDAAGEIGDYAAGKPCKVARPGAAAEAIACEVEAIGEGKVTIRLKDAKGLAAGDEVELLAGK